MTRNLQADITHAVGAEADPCAARQSDTTRQSFTPSLQEKMLRMAADARRNRTRLAVLVVGVREILPIGESSGPIIGEQHMQ